MIKQVKFQQDESENIIKLADQILEMIKKEDNPQVNAKLFRAIKQLQEAAQIVRDSK